MRCTRHLEQTPGLIDADVTDEVGNEGAGVGRAKWRDVGARRAVQAKVARGSVDRSSVDDLRPLKSLALLSSTPTVNDTPLPNWALYWAFVDAGDGVIATDQIGGVVAREALPRRDVGRSRLTEGEARELDEGIFQAERAAAKEVAGGNAVQAGRIDGRLQVDAAADSFVPNVKSAWPKVRTTPYSVAVRVSMVRAMRE